VGSPRINLLGLGEMGNVVCLFLFNIRFEVARFLAQNTL
jgi:hypothetical protein